MGKRKYTFEEVNQFFTERGYLCLEEIYVNIDTPMKYKCSCGNISRIRVHDLLCGHGCKRCGNESSSKNRQLFDDTVFDSIGIKEAYFLGLYWSDGCISNFKGRKTLLIEMTDKDVIEQCKKFFKSENKIGVIHKLGRKPIYRFQIGSKKIYDNFIKLGCLPQKSLLSEAPKINKNLFYPFLMGVFDGDGCIYLRKDNNWVASIVTGSIKFHTWLYNFLKEENLLFRSIEERSSDGNYIYRIIFSGITVKLFLNKIYSSVEGVILPMNRKLLLYNRVLKHKFKCGIHFQDWELDYIKDSSLSNKSVSEAISNDTRSYWNRSTTSIGIKRKKLIKATNGNEETFNT